MAHTAVRMYGVGATLMRVHSMAGPCVCTAERSNWESCPVCQAWGGGGGAVRQMQHRATGHLPLPLPALHMQPLAHRGRERGPVSDVGMTQELTHSHGGEGWALYTDSCSWPEPAGRAGLEVRWGGRVSNVPLLQQPVCTLTQDCDLQC